MDITHTLILKLCILGGTVSGGCAYAWYTTHQEDRLRAKRLQVSFDVCSIFMGRGASNDLPACYLEQPCEGQ
jgi:hypothetical protein